MNNSIDEYNRRIRDRIKDAIDNSEDELDYFKDIIPLEIELFNAKEKHSEVTKKKNIKWRNVAKAAAILLAIFVTSNVLAIYYSEHNTVQAFKSRIEDIVWKINGAEVLTSDSESGGDKLILHYEKWDDLDEAKKLVEDLHIPEYIPSGYAFDSLVIEKSEESPYSITYQFKNQKNDTLFIIQNHVDDIGSVLISIKDVYKEKSYSTGVVYLSKCNSNKESICGSIITENYLINIISTLSEEEITKIADNLR